MSSVKESPVDILHNVLFPYQDRESFEWYVRSLALSSSSKRPTLSLLLDDSLTLSISAEFQGLAMDTLTKTSHLDAEEDKQTVGRAFVDNNLRMKKIASHFSSLTRAWDYEKPMPKWFRSPAQRKRFSPSVHVCWW